MSIFKARELRLRYCLGLRSGKKKFRKNKNSLITKFVKITLVIKLATSSIEIRTKKTARSV
jgi:hypothetical protein